MRRGFRRRAERHSALPTGPSAARPYSRYAACVALQPPLDGLLSEGERGADGAEGLGLVLK